MGELNGINLGVSGSSFNAKGIIDKTIEKRQKLIEPTKIRLEQNKVKLDAWNQAKTLMEDVRNAAEPLIPLSAWNKKKVTISDEEILTAKAGSAAEPGTHYITVEQVSMSHIVGSQTYDKEDAYIGTGTIEIKVDDGDYKTIKIDESQNNIKGLVDAINNSGVDVKAQIVKTDHNENNFRVVLTSKIQGEDGYLNIITKFESGLAPQFDNYYTEPSEWKFAPKEIEEGRADDTGASNTVPVFSGTYTGEDYLELKFTAMNTGKIGGDNAITIRWQDNLGREGRLDLSKFNYSPGKAIEVVDGVKVSFTEGDVVINDTFTVEAKPDESGSWWVSEENEPSKIMKPSVWSRQYDSGKPLITGTFKGEDDVYTLKVKKGGVIGSTEEVIIEYESENGSKGELNVGRGYKPGDKLALGQGLELSLEKGVLQKGFESKFEAEEGVPGDYWWLFPDNEAKDAPPQISKSLDWYGFDGNQVDLSKNDLINPENEQSNVEKQIVGNYNSMVNKIYKFSVEGNGTVGVTKGIYLNWEDDKGNEGTLSVGENYKPGDKLFFDSGLSLVLGKGQIFNEDSFTFEAYSSTIQPAQDALIRLGADPGDGGLQIRNNTNEFKDAIRGVTLNIHQASDTAVILNIEDDKEAIKENIKNLIDKYNEALKFFIEALKYDISTQEAGPLQADSTLAGVQRKMSEMLIDPIQGLVKGKNTLSAAGISVVKTGLVEFNEEVFNNLLSSDYETVANLFRNYGDSDNSGILFLNAGINTQPSREEGFQVDITQAATSGSYTSPLIRSDIVIDKSNSNFKVSVDGKESGVITMDAGNYSLKQFARDLEKKMKADDNIGKREFTVIAENDQLIVRSGTYGSSSKIEFEKMGNTLTSRSLNVLEGESLDGKNVEGTIDGEKMEGQGRVLRGMKETNFDGLRLYSFLTESQVKEGKEAMLRVSKGVAQRVKGYFDEALQSKGMVDNSTQSIKDQISQANENIKKFDKRLKQKQDSMVQQFASMESKISELKSQQRYLSSQFPTG